MRNDLRLILAAGLTLLAPALVPGAQARPAHNDAWYLTPQRNAQIREDIADLGDAIDRTAARRAISAREARSLRQQARDVRLLYARYVRDGLTRAEVRALQSRVNQVRQGLRMERRDWDGHPG